MDEHMTPYNVMSEMRTSSHTSCSNDIRNEHNNAAIHQITLLSISIQCWPPA